MTDREAIKIALEALENGKRVRAGEGGTKYQPDLEDAAITALRQAIEQAEQWDTSDMAHRSGGLTVDVTDLIQRAKAEERKECAEHYLTIMRDVIEQAVKREREACAKLCDEWSKRTDDVGAFIGRAIRGRTE